jgi:predicted RNase H-like HicB family nuclease
MNFTIEHEREADGRWLAEVPELPGVLAYGATAAEAMAKAEVLALRVLAERLEHNEAGPSPFRSLSRAHDLVAFDEGPPCSCRTLPDWLDPQAPVRFTQDALPPWLA